MNHVSKATSPESTTDPCLQIQVDLSAMLDGELASASVRRVLVHADVCASCRMFLRGIRAQARAHVELNAIFDGGDLARVDLDAAPRRPRTLAEQLRRTLVENRAKLARILYELGRGYVLMGSNPSFYRAVAREPVPIPDVCMRGRSLLDEVRRLSSAVADEAVGREWVRAKLLFVDTGSGTAEANLERGLSLLREALLLRPQYHEARIYLGHGYHIQQRRDLARQEFRIVLGATDDPIMRAFALENLGNVDLEEGFPERSIPLFLTLVESGVVQREPRFYTAYFNLALAYGLIEDFESSGHWLERLHREFPHRRRMVGEELGSRRQLAAILARRPDVVADLSRRFPTWFPLSQEVS